MSLVGVILAITNLLIMRYLLLFFLFCSCIQRSAILTGIEIVADRETLNPVLEPDFQGTINVVGHYSDGSIKTLDSNDVAIKATTKLASGNVTVIELVGDRIIPKEGGIATVQAVYVKDNQTFIALKDIHVRPFYREYHKTLVLKLFMAYEGEPVNENDKKGLIFSHKDPSRICTFEQALDVIRRVDNLTRGVPKIIYLVGWQRGGHDHQYPDWGIVNDKLKREQDDTATQSLRWLIREARTYNTTVSLHINMVDAFEESQLWNKYVGKDVIGRDEKGALLPSWQYIKGHQAYNISYTREWEEGLATRRIDNLIRMLPELEEGHTVHVDVFIAYREGKIPLSPWHSKQENGGMDMYKEVETQRKIFKYWREKGFDVTGEGIFWMHPPGEGFVGLQPMSWWYPDDKDFQMSVPERLSARGRTHRGGSEAVQGDYRFGSSMQGEEVFLTDLESLPDFLLQFCTSTLPWLYLSQYDRKAFIDNKLYYDNGIVAGDENGNKMIRQGSFVVRENNDLFVPAVWCPQEIIAFSVDGYTNKTWQMPKEWNDIETVDIYRISQQAPVLMQSNTPISNHTLTISLKKGEAISIVPSGINILK
jgi:hypothetical protein